MNNGKNLFQRTLRFWFPVLAIIIPLIVIALAGKNVGSLAFQRTVTEMMISIVVVVGLYVFVGNSGIISFGHATFMAIAAYASAWQTCCEMLKPITMSGLPAFVRDQSIPLLPSALISVLLAGVAAALSGLILMRLTGLAASISTLALLFILNVVYSNWDSVTMGTASIVGLPTYVTTTTALVCAVFVIIVAYLYQTSRFGLAIRATREDEVAAAASGISLYWSRLIAFTLSGFMVGIGGVLQAHFLGAVSINSFFLGLTFLSLAMLIVGGAGSLAGAVVGVVVITLLVDVFRRFEAGISLGGDTISIPAGSQELIIAAFMLCVLIFRKDGIMAGREFTWPRRQHTTNRLSNGS
ncbi:branched-chain amino acid ABC transporter permease [Rhizobium pusense]|uniref:branched-chain amino acid ABC transporter permease n=1 Tax=Agrobacterium pusense TaxID=648995 RepID=UPI00244D2BE9|nr:branched-chain amino acid ABC transporter permease [Agrobacterium pusense]MDH1270771.1 branched-chain amino acid ABC transporter permease [Agrobacterium pusense]